MFHKSNQFLLLGFALLYPMLLFPGALLDTPGVITDSVKGAAIERFMMLPKLIALSLIGLLGFLQIRQTLRPTLLVYVLASHLVWVILSTLNARDELTYNLLGPYIRLDGLIYHFAIVAVLLFAYALIKANPRLEHLLLYALLGGGVLQSILVLCQRLGFDPIGPLVRWVPYNIPAGTLGHPGMVAGYLLPLVVVGAWLALQTTKRNLRIALFSCSAFIALGLSLTNGRAAFIGLALALLGLLLLRRRWDTLALSGGLMLVLLAGPYLIPNQQGYGRQYTDSRSFEVRQQIWPLAIRVMQYMPNFPWLGGGPDGFKLAILRNIEAEAMLPLFRLELGWPENARVHSVKYTREAGAPLRTTMLDIKFDQFGEYKDLEDNYPMLLDRAHNLWLDRLLSFGIFSVITWLIFYLYPVLRSWQTRDLAATGIGVAILALMIYYLVWFPVSQVEPSHLLLAVWLWARLDRGASAQD